MLVHSISHHCVDFCIVGFVILAKSEQKYFLLRTQLYTLLLINILPIQIYGQDILNGGFESWENNVAGVSYPKYWETQNELGLVFVDRAKGHTGLYSTSLHVVWDNMLQKFTGASMSQTENILAYEKIESLTGYCKGSPNNTDTLKFSVYLYSCNELVGTGSSCIVQTSDIWEQFVVSIKYYSNKTPEKMKISFSIIPVNGSHYQTTYLIDDLMFKTKTNN